jgi:RHS repeat-associated protein
MNTHANGLLQADVHQSVIGIVHAADTSIIGYSAHGWRHQTSKLPMSGFNGQRAERQTGWYYLGNGRRIYNPVLQRFHSPDPLSPFEQGGLNAYAYCLGDPVNYQDPSGSAAQLPDWAGPVMTIAGNSAGFGAILLAGIVGRPRGIGLLGTRMTLIGAPVAIAGATMQLTGGKEAGRIMAWLGSAMTTVGAGMRFGQSVINLMKKPHPWDEFIAGFRHLLGLKPKKTLNKVVAPPVPSPIESPGKTTLKSQGSSDLQLTRDALSSSNSAQIQRRSSGGASSPRVSRTSLNSQSSTIRTKS